MVEDEPSICDNLIYSLESEGFQVTCCHTCAEAREKLAKEQIHLVVLDVGLPDGSGFDLCREMRGDKSPPIIFLTARSSEIDRVVGLEIGGDDYLTKPFSPRELTARVRAVLRRSQPSESTPQTVGPESPKADGLVVDEERCEIRLDGVALPLSRYEFRLLKALHARPGRVFSRAQLMDQAWEEPEASLERTVDSHIKSLRAKLREVRKEFDPIRTHRGLGYSWTEES